MRKDFMAATALGSAAFVVAWSGQAVAQSAPNFDWAGPYIGGSLGFAGNSSALLAYPNVGSLTSGQVDFIDNAPQFWAATPGTYAPWPTTLNLNSQLGASANWGINRQSGNLVYGIEADASLYAGLGHFRWHNEETSFGRVSDVSVDGGVDALFTLRPRIGVAVDRLLLFGTGGLAVGHAAFNTTASLSDSGKGVAAWSGSNSAWRPGFVVGGGGEYAVNEKFSVKFEALYYNLGTMNITANGTGMDTSPASVSVAPYSGSMTLQGTVARVGLNFHL